MTDKYTPDMVEMKRKFPDYFEGWDAAVRDFLRDGNATPETVISSFKHDKPNTNFQRGFLAFNLAAVRFNKEAQS